MAAHYAKYLNIIPTAGILTGLVFTGLTGTVFLTRHDFSWMRPALMIAGIAALGEGDGGAKIQRFRGEVGLQAPEVPTAWWMGTLQ